MTTVNGAVLLARRNFVTTEHGEEAWQRILGQLSEEDRETLGGVILTSQWYPFPLNARLDVAIVSTLGRGADSMFEAIGAQSARDSLEGRHSHFLAPGDPQRFLAKTDRIYDAYYDTGYRTWEATGPTSGVMTTHEAETFSRADCLTVIGWYKEALRLCGARNVEMVEEACRAQGGPCCRYRLSWTMPGTGAAASSDHGS